MMLSFGREVEQLTGGTTPMGVREILIERSRNEGRKEGRKEGLEQARNESFERILFDKQETARICKSKGLGLEFISEITGLGIQELEAL